MSEEHHYYGPKKDHYSAEVQRKINTLIYTEGAVVPAVLGLVYLGEVGLALSAAAIGFMAGGRAIWLMLTSPMNYR